MAAWRISGVACATDPRLPTTQTWNEGTTSLRSALEEHVVVDEPERVARQLTLIADCPGQINAKIKRPPCDLGEARIAAKSEAPHDRDCSDRSAGRKRPSPTKDEGSNRARSTSLWVISEAASLTTLPLLSRWIGNFWPEEIVLASRRRMNHRVSASGELHSSRSAASKANASSPALDRSPAGVGRLAWCIAGAIILTASIARAGPPTVQSQTDDASSSFSPDIVEPVVNLRTLAGQPTSTLGPPGVSGDDGYLFDLSDLLKPFGRTLAQRGIYLRLGYTGDFADYASGGYQQGQAGDSQFLNGLDLDLARLAGLPGTRLHFLLVSRFGATDNKTYIGSTYEIFSVAGPTVTTRLAELSLEQSLLSGRLRFLVGRIPVGQEFAVSPVYCQFVSGLCFNLSPFAWPRNSNIGYWPLASWGGRVTFQPTPRTYVKAGAFVADPAAYEKSGFPWNGGWATSPGSGAFFPFELGYTSDPSSKRLPYALDVGGYYDASTYADLLYNEAGQSRVIDHGRAAVDQGRASMYLQGQQVLWRPDSHSQRGLTIFGGVFASAAGHAAASSYFLTGLVDKGLFEARSADTLGLMSYTVLLNQRVIEAYSDSLVAEGRTGNLSRSETAFELNYSLAIAPGVAIKPFVQLVLHPDQIGLSPDPADTHAWVLGFQLSTVLNDTLGLPIMARPN